MRNVPVQKLVNVWRFDLTAQEIPMKRIMVMAALGLLLAMNAALAQQSSTTLLAQSQSGRFVVLFPLGSSTLDSEALGIVREAATEFQRTGSAQISVRGHADTSGSADFNQALSERREQAVADELIQLGVPADAIMGEAFGETELAVPTADGIPEAQNRRVDIDVEQPAPVVAEPAPAPSPPPAPEPTVAVVQALERGLFTVGLFYGYNIEDEEGGSSHLGGINLGADYTVLPWLGLGVEQAGFYHFSTDDEGFGGRTAGSVNLLLGHDDVVPYIGGNIGYLYGSGIDDDFFAGPEIGINAGKFHAKIAYDIPFNRSLDEGIIATTIGVGFRF
jgi:outer membrane protein OmpA-like peptidoglycan-associated protein